MKIYQFASITSSDNRIYLHCTDPQLIHSLVEQLKKIVSNYKVEQQLNDLSGDLCQVRIKFSDGDINLQAYYWFQKQFCKLGWEPLGDGEFRFIEP